MMMTSRAGTTALSVGYCTFAARALSLMTRQLDDSFGGVVLADEEGQNIAKALGQKKAVILQVGGCPSHVTS